MRRAKHKGIVLAEVNFGPGSPFRYRHRHGRAVAYSTVAGLDRVWLDAYVQFFRRRGQPERAMQLKAELVAEQRKVEE